MSPTRTAGRGGRYSYEELRSSITCPHCWHDFRASDIAWVAKHEDLRGDPVLGSDAHVRFLPTRFNVAGDALDSRGMACQQLACPRCHLAIPRIFLSSEPLIFSLIGVPFSGKSYFLTAMAWELSRLAPTRFALSFRDVDISSNLTITEYQKTLFLQDDRDRPVGIIKTQLDSATHYDSTNLDGQAVLLPRPLYFTLRPMKDHPNAKILRDVSRVLCLYDNAGEHFLPGQDTTLAPGTQHMARSKVLMFLYDPTQDPRVREACKPISGDPQLSSEYAHTQLQSTILTEAAARVRQYAHLPADARLKQPLLVLVSKSDVWRKLIDEDVVGDPYLDPAPPERTHSLVHVGRIRRTSEKIRKMLLELAPEFVATADDCCEEVVYVPVSALGCSPKPQKEGKLLVVKPKDVKPRWVTVPILYAFSVWASHLVPAQVER